MRPQDEPEFCPECDVTMELHDGPDTCHFAERKAVLLEMAFGEMAR